MRKSFVFYRSFYEAIKDLPRDIQGEIYTAIMEYGLNGNETENLKPVARSIFTLIKPNLEANIKRYENGCKSNGRPKKTEEKPKENQNITKPEPDKDVDVDKDYDKDKDVNDLTQEELSCESVVKKEGEKLNYQAIVDEFNATLSPPLPRVVVVSDARRRAMKARITEHGLEAIKTVYANVLHSKFLRGESENGWKCHFDWIFNPRNFIKILEGSYADNRTNYSEKQRANEYAMQQLISDRIAREQGMVNEVEKPF